MNAWTIGALAGAGLLLLARRAGVAIAPANGDPMAPTDDAAPGVAPGVRDFAIAIAAAEGFGVTGAIPTRAHNPGDLAIPGWTGPTLGAEKISVFRDDAQGWAALHAQLQRILDGRSHVYTPATTIEEMAESWAPRSMASGGEQDPNAWAVNVVDKLRALGYVRVTLETPIGEVLAGDA